MVRDTEGRVCRYPRLGLHDDPEQWMEFARREDKVVLLNADDHVAFAYYVESDEFESGGTWRTHAIDPESGKLTTAHTNENLVERRFEEAVSNHRAFVLDVDETPLKEDKYVTQ